jgi:glucose-6-phosphate isomerase
MMQPYTFDLDANMRPTVYDDHILRRLSDLKGQCLDPTAWEAALAQADALVYEVYEFKRPEVAGELLHGISIVHPGRIGEEYYMTKGHFHRLLETAEIYACLKGEGCMVMETPEGEASVAELRPGRVLYVPPRWAHRSVNTGREDLVTLFVYPGDAGHDYGTIETRGFRKLVVEREGRPMVIDNPRWAGNMQAQ